MKASYFVVLVCCFYLTVSKYSYTDKCYRFRKNDEGLFKIYYQFYYNKKGIPHSRDYIVFQSLGSSKVWSISFYYHYVLSDCNKIDTGFRCNNTCESVWFKIENKTAANSFVEKCDPIFQKKYGDIMKHSCNMTMDPFSYIRAEIGKSDMTTIDMDGKVPVAPHGFVKDTKCVWEWDVIGLWSLVSLIVISVLIVLCLIVLLIIIILVQNHRSSKRRRLENSLLHKSDPSISFVS